MTKREELTREFSSVLCLSKALAQKLSSLIIDAAKEELANSILSESEKGTALGGTKE